MKKQIYSETSVQNTVLAAIWNGCGHSMYVCAASAAARALVLFLGISASGALQNHATMTSFHGARALPSYVVLGQSKTV